MEVFPLHEIDPQSTPSHQLANRIGLELSYETIWGHTKEVNSASANAIVKSLTGEHLELDNAHAVATYLEKLHSQKADLPKTIVEFSNQPLKTLRELFSKDNQNIEIHIKWENQSSTFCNLNSESIACLATPGYHQITLYAQPDCWKINWILTPERCHAPSRNTPLNGLNCFLPSLRSNRNWGAGDLTDLNNFARKLTDSNTFDFIALNPLHAIHNRAPYNTSPYLPLSIFTRNLLYLDIESIPEFAQSSCANRIYRSSRFQEKLLALRTSEFVNYEEVASIKTFFLKLLYRQFLRGNKESLHAYVASRGKWLLNYCTYMAFDRQFHRKDRNLWHWQQWPEPYQTPLSGESIALSKRLHTQILFFAYIEMRLEEQLAAVHQNLKQHNYKLGLYQDLALATDRVGADYWAYQDLFAPGVRVGSPPDDFNENGQDWGFPALHPQRHADSGYTYFVESIRCAARHSGAIRFDHVMRLARLYWIPDHMSAKDGAYVRDHFEDLLKILALESQRAKVIVVGEDLGTVPGYFRKALDECGILSYRLVLFERSGSEFKSPEDYPCQAIASFTTHDLPTLDGWLTGADLRGRIATGQLPSSELDSSLNSRNEAIISLRRAFDLHSADPTADDFFEGLCKFLAATPSLLRLLNIEELTAETEQQNMPGTTSEAPNWQRRLHAPIEKIFSDPVFAKRLRIWSSAMHQSNITSQESQV